MLDAAACRLQITLFIGLQAGTMSLGSVRNASRFTPYAG